MNNQSAVLHEFLLLFLNLAEMKHRERVLELFCQTWNAKDLPVVLEYSNEPVAGQICEPIATQQNAFGFFILRQESGLTVDEVMPLARNLIKLLAVILENLQCEELLEKEGAVLEKMAEDRVSEIKQGEQALSESEEKFRALYENAPLPYQSLDEKGCFLDVNPAWLRILGYKRDEVIGQCYADFLHPDWKPHFEKNFPAFKKRGYVSDVQFKIRHKDGQYRDISFEGCIGYHPDGSFRQTYCVFQDITEKKRTEEALIEKEHFISAVADTAPALIYVYDLETNCNVYANSGIERLLGYSPEEIQQMGENLLFLLVHPDDFHLVEAQHSKICNAIDDAVYSYEYRMKNKDGAWRHMQSDERVFSRNTEGSPKQKIGFSIDITEQKQMEKALKNNETLLNETAMTAKVGGWEIDLSRATLAWTDETFYIHELDPTEQPDVKEAINYYHPDERSRIEEAVQKAVETGEPFDFEARLITARGNLKWVQAKGHAVITNGNEKTVQGVIQDITERKQIQQELETYRDHLEEQVHARTEELRRTVNLMAGREVRMAELKREIADLKKQLSKGPGQ